MQPLQLVSVITVALVYSALVQFQTAAYQLVQLPLTEHQFHWVVLEH